MSVTETQTPMPPPQAPAPVSTYFPLGYKEAAFQWVSYAHLLYNYLR